MVLPAGGETLKALGFCFQYGSVRAQKFCMDGHGTVCFRLVFQFYDGNVVALVSVSFILGDEFAYGVGMFRTCDRLLVRIFVFIVRFVFILIVIVIFDIFIVFIISADFDLDFIFVVVIINDLLWRFGGGFESSGVWGMLHPANTLKQSRMASVRVSIFFMMRFPFHKLVAIINGDYSFPTLQRISL